MIQDILRRMIQARVDKGLTLGEACVHVGLAPNSLGDMERGVTPFPLARMLTLSELYGVSMIWIVSGITPNFDAEMVKEQLEAIRDAASEAIEEMENGAS